MINHQPAETQVSTISAVGEAIRGWETSVEVGIWRQPSQESSHLTDLRPETDE
jgi:hypothetical protein